MSGPFQVCPSCHQDWSDPQSRRESNFYNSRISSREPDSRISKPSRVCYRLSSGVFPIDELVDEVKTCNDQRQLDVQVAGYISRQTKGVGTPAPGSQSKHRPPASAD
jgi:hypothetical protein